MAEQKEHDEQVAKIRGDNPNIMFIIERSKNFNIVVYEGMLDGDKLSDKEPVSVYWLDIDPAYVKANRAKGVESDRSDLNMLEKKMAYGLSSKANGDGTYEVSLVAFAQRKVEVSIKDGKPQAAIVINGKKAKLSKIYVKSIERTLRLPKVEYIELTGEDLESGEAVSEKVTP